MTAKFTKQEIQAELLERGGNISAVARHFNVSRQTIYNYIKKERVITYDRLIKIRESKQQEIIEEAITQLEKAVKSGNRWAIERILTSNEGSYLRFFRNYYKKIV